MSVFAKSTICPNCKQLRRGFSDEGVNECAICGTPVTLDFIGNPKPFLIHLESRVPSQTEITHLKHASFEQVPLSKPEKRRAILRLVAGSAGGLACVAVFIFLAIVVIAIVTGARENPFSFFHFWFYIGLAVAAWKGLEFCAKTAFSGFCLLTRSARKKSVDEAFAWLWQQSYLGDELDFAFKAVMQSLPGVMRDKVDKPAWEQYLTRLHSNINDQLTTMANAVDLQCNLKKNKPLTNEWTDSSRMVFAQVDSSTEASFGVMKIVGRVSIVQYKKATWFHMTSLTDTHEEAEIAVAQVDLVVRGHYIQSGEYWIPYDIMPTAV